MHVNRQSVILGLRFSLLIVIVAFNAYIIWKERAFKPVIMALSLLSIPLFYLLLTRLWEPLRLRLIIGHSNDMIIIPPHYAWNFHRESRSDYCCIPGTLALTDHLLYFVSSPLYTDTDILCKIPLRTITRVSNAPPKGKWGNFLTLTLQDGATVRFKFSYGHQQYHWQQELCVRVYEQI